LPNIVAGWLRNYIACFERTLLANLFMQGGKREQRLQSVIAVETGPLALPFGGIADMGQANESNGRIIWARAHQLSIRSQFMTIDFRNFHSLFHQRSTAPTTGIVKKL
jgi:hypothetical protein